VGFFFVSILFQSFYDSSREMMMMLMLMQKYSVPMFRQCSADWNRPKLLILKEKSVLFLCLFQCSNIYIKVDEFQKHFTMYSGLRVSGRSSLGKGVKNTEHWNRNDNEAPKPLISLAFLLLKNTEQRWNKRNNA
jgi:hypothetical protein